MIFLFYYTINMAREKTFCNLFFPPIKCVKYKIAGRWRSDKTECFLPVECVKHEINRRMSRLEALRWAWNAGTWEVRSEWSIWNAGKWNAWNMECGYPGSGIRILNYKKEPCDLTPWLSHPLRGPPIPSARDDHNLIEKNHWTKNHWTWHPGFFSKASPCHLPLPPGFL